MERNRKMLLLLGLLFCLVANAQDVADKKKEFNNVKKNPEYIYGQSSGEDEQKCYEIAYSEFLTKLKEYIAADESLKSAAAVIVEKMQKGVKKISFERYLNCKVVCVYINKNDIKPIQQSDILDTTKVSVPVIINSVVEQKTDTIDNSVKAIVEKKTVEQAMTEVTPQSATINIIDVGNAKENEILNEISNLSDFSKISVYLNNRKTSNHDIVFKATKQFGNVVNAYWLVFDQNKKLIALLSKDKTQNLLTNKSVNSNEYSNSPKVWLQIY